MFTFFHAKPIGPVERVNHYNNRTEGTESVYYMVDSKSGNLRLARVKHGLFINDVTLLHIYVPYILRKE